MGQQPKKNKAGGKAGGGLSGGGGNNGSGKVSNSSTPPQTGQQISPNAEKQTNDGDAREGSMWGRLLSRSGRSLVSHGQQASARGHAPSPSSHKAQGTSQAEAGGTGGRNSGPLVTANSAKAGGEGQPQAAPRSGQGAPATGTEDRKRRSQKDRVKQGNPWGKKDSDKSSTALSAYLKRLFSYDSFRSKLIGWVVNLAVAAAVIGIFALKAAEEFYGQDISRGAQREEHLTALQLDASASEMDIRKAYRTLSIRWHPDKNPGCPSCQARFTEVAAAYEYLMRDFRKQKEEQATAGSSEGATAGGRGPTAQDDKYAGKAGKNDIVDFTYLSASEPFYPATDKQVWTILLRHGKDEFTDRVYEMWAETALALGKYVKYGLVDVHKNKALLKRLPVKVKIFPAIFVVSHGMHPELYPAIAHPSVEGIRSFISRSFPNHVTVVSSASELRAYLGSTTPPFSRAPLGWLAQPYKVVLLPAADSPASPPVALKATAMKYRNIFLFAYVQNVKGLLLEGTEAAKEEFVSLLRQPSSSAAACKARHEHRRGGGAAPSETAEQQQDGGCSASDQLQPEDAALHFTETDLKNYLTVLLFANEGPGMRSRVVERLRIPNLFSRRESQRVAFGKLPRLLASQILPWKPVCVHSFAAHGVGDAYVQRIHPYLYQENAPLLCRGTPQERMFTLVLVEPPHLATPADTGDVAKQAASTGSKADEPAVPEEEFTLAEVAALVEGSRKRYAEKHRNMLGAATAQQQEGQENADKREEREAEDYATEGADDDENSDDTTFRLQIARMSFDSPAELPGLAGISASSPFVDFWKDQMQSSRMFLLHLDGSRYALLSGATAAGTEKDAHERQRRQAATKELLSELYQVLEKHVQHHRFASDGDYDEQDEEDSATSSGGTSKTRLVWQSLPPACDWTHFIKSCLPTAAAPWWWELLTSILDISSVQLGVVAVVGLTIYFFGSNASYEALLGVILCGSLLIGGFEQAHSVCSKLWAKLSSKM